MKKTVIVAGMAYGDEAKGATVDYLCRSLGASLVVRYNGGHQAAHNVVLDDGRHHTFSQFGSGTLIPGVRTHLSRFMLINPIAMMREAEHLEYLGVADVWDRLTVDENCVIVTPYHRAMNRLEEIARGSRAHGSCGVGIGVARRLEIAGTALRVKDLRDRLEIARRLMEIRSILLHEAKAFAYDLEDTPEVLQELNVLQLGDVIEETRTWYRTWMHKAKVVEQLDVPDTPLIFEGAQGVLLDEKYGDAPHNTWTNTTFDNALTLLEEASYSGEVVKMGCWRSYFTRHGTGPLGNELKRPEKPWPGPELHNGYGRYQGEWRVAPFDYEAARHAVGICGGIDEIALSHLDYASEESVIINNLERYARAPVTILGYGPTARSRKAREREDQHPGNHREEAGSLR